MTDRRPHDFYPTPQWCIDLVLREPSFVDTLRHTAYFPWGDKPIILDSGVGEGAVIRRFMKHIPSTNVDWRGIDIRPECREATEDLDMKFIEGSFLQYDPEQALDLIIGNPPFSLAQEFVDHATCISYKTLYLLPLNFLATQRRNTLVRELTPDVFVLANRPSFTGSGNAAAEYAWFRFPGMGHIKVLPHVDKKDRK